MDAIGVAPEQASPEDGPTVYIHIEQPDRIELMKSMWREDVGPHLCAALCGVLIQGKIAVWYDGLSDVDCPVCLDIVRLGKSARIGKSRLKRHASLGESIEQWR